MRTMTKRVLRDESGKILILVLVLLVVGGLLLTPLLGLMSTGLMAGQVYEKKTSELYAADAGVEDAVWRIQNKKVEFDKNGFYAYPDPAGGVAEVWVVNDKSVGVEIWRERIGESGPCHVEYDYRILSTAKGVGSSTSVDAHLSVYYEVTPDFSGLLQHVIVSRCDYTLQGGQMDVTPGEGEPHGPVKNYGGYWPTAKILSDWYRKDVDGYEVDWGSIELNNSNVELEPVLIDNNGDYVLKVLNSVNPKKAPPTLKLTGTVYITGDMWIGQTGHEFILDLNGQTMFVESATGAAPESKPCQPGNQYALLIGDKVTIRGSGAIIAIGNIELKPNFDGSEGDYLLVMSVLGKTYMQPVGEFYGTLAGTSEVYLQNSTAEWREPPADLNFPMGESEEVDEEALPISEMGITSWRIK